MDLAEFVKHRGAQTDLARAIGCPSQLIWQWARGVRPIPEDRCPSLEKATLGAVRCEDMRPDVPWARIPDAEWQWHPEGRPVIDVTADRAQYKVAA
jgi:DNA-binding transcriptional regulator YdaS (Cro superfamily)